MSDLQKLYSAKSDAKDAFESAKDALHSYLEPILEAVGIDRVYVEGVEFNASEVIVRYGWSCRGCRSDDAITLPVAIFESVDPLTAAREWKERDKAKKKAANEAETRAQIERLQKSLEPQARAGEKKHE